MGLIDGLTGKIAKHNKIKNEGAEFLFSCANNYKEGTFLNIHYKALGALYLNYCLYLFESTTTPSYKENIKRVNYEYMMKYMVSIITCELCHMKEVEPVLIKENLNIDNFIEIISMDCKFNPSERQSFIDFASNYENENWIVKNSLRLGYAKEYYEKAVLSNISTEENLAVAGSNKNLIQWFFNVHENICNAK